MSNENTYPTLADTQSIEHFMTTFGQEVNRKPVKNPPADVRILRGRLVLEEAFELIQALGLKVSLSSGQEPVTVDPKAVTLHDDPDVEYDMVETADALADSIVVVKGSASALGIPVDELLLEEVMPSNMSKLEDGEVLRDAGGKILKGKDFFVPNVQRILDRYTD